MVVTNIPIEIYILLIYFRVYLVLARLLIHVSSHSNVYSPKEVRRVDMNIRSLRKF